MLIACLYFTLTSLSLSLTHFPDHLHYTSPRRSSCYPGLCRKNTSSSHGRWFNRYGPARQLSYCLERRITGQGNWQNEDVHRNQMYNNFLVERSGLTVSRQITTNQILLQTRHRTPFTSNLQILIMTATTSPSKTTPTIIPIKACEIQAAINMSLSSTPKRNISFYIRSILHLT